MPLIEEIPAADPERSLIYTPEATYTVHGLLRCVAAFRDTHPACRGASVGLRSASSADLALGLLALDGFARRIVLLPEDQSDHHDRFRQDAELEQVVACGLPHDPSLSWGASDSLPKGPVPSTRGVESPSVSTWWVPTSGTTGTPKLISHTLESLTRSIQRNTTIGQELIWGLCFDLNRFAGLQVFLQAMLGGSSIAMAGDLRSLENQSELYRQAGVNALSATPSQWRRFLMSGVLDDLPLRILTLGGEPADDLVLRELRQRFPGARLTHIYASTEAGVCFAVKDGRAGFPASWVRTEKVESYESEQAGAAPPPALAVTEDGELLVELPTEGDHSPAAFPGFLGTGDLVERRGDRYYFLGRKNGAINVGGLKVQPSEVEQVLLRHESVGLAAVAGRRNPIMGQVVEAWVVLKSPLRMDEGMARDRILAHCREHLDSYKVPAALHLVEDLELNASGKIRRGG